MSLNEPRGRRSRLLIPIALVAVVLAACGGAASTPGILSTVGSAVDPNGGEPQPAASEAPALAPEDNGGQSPQGGTGGVPSAPRDDLKIVYTGSLELVVEDLGAALAKARTAVLAAGGYIGASQESNDGDRSVATITYRIPATRWGDSVDALRALATKVVGEQTQATEVGGQLVDLEARLRNLRASEDVLVEIAKGTGKVSDLLEVQQRISEVRGQIEQIDGQRLQLEDQVALGTLVVTFGTQVVQVQEAAQGWDPRTDVDGATATLISAGQALVSGAIWFGIVWLPVILVLVVLALTGRWLFRRFAPKRVPAGPVPGWGGGPGTAAS
ncbi:MAG TPA: DUF4349 domain-containing protein [Candidatus Limnocylindrales bacterium]|nr:DUF4349 domain-containing protein [Candidatus Limnocylindrales bacterium]